MNWSRFAPSDFEYDFERDELAAHRVTFEEALECFFSDFVVRRNKSFRDRYQLIGRTWRTSTQNHFSVETAESCADHYGVGDMSKRRKALTEQEIDAIVIAQAENDMEWEEPVVVHGKLKSRFDLPAELAARAAFVAQLYRENSASWLTKVIRERVELEEAAFAGAKRELTLQGKR